MRIRRVLVVCVGNICRSPMAEAMLRKELDHQTDTRVSSAGLGALAGHAASKHAIELMADRGIDISEHKARQLTPDLVSDSDLILVMEQRHRKAIESVEPAARGKIYRFCEWTGEDVPDPYQKPRQAFEEAVELIERGVQDWVGKLTA